MIAGVVLAAGLSSRMGQNKLLLQLEGKSVVRRAVETAIAAGLSPVFVVVGHQRESIEAELRGLDCAFVFNSEYATGMSSSMRAGIRAVPDSCDGALLMLGDMPLVSTPMLMGLLEAFRASRPPLVISTYETILAPPVLYGCALFDELRAPDAEGKAIIQRHRAEAIECSWPARALIDLDSPEDLERVREALKKS